VIQGAVGIIGDKMAKREKTKHPGLYYKIVRCKIDHTQTEKKWESRYTHPIRKKQVEATLGYETSDKMSEEDALFKMLQLKRGDIKTKTEIKEEQKTATEEEYKFSFQVLWDKFISHTDKNGKVYCDKPIIKSNRTHFNKYILPVLGNLKPSTLTTDDVNKLSKYAFNQGKGPQSVKHILSLLKRMLKWAELDRKNLKIHYPTVPKVKREYLTQDEKERLLAVLKVWPNRPVADMMALIMCTGVRRGELFKLKWRDVNFSRKEMTLVEPKGGTDVIIRMSDAAEKILCRQLRTSDPKVKTHPHPNNYVFPGKGGKKRFTVQKTKVDP
jgi:hypothetical protein